AAPPAGRMSGTIIRPLTQIGLSQYHCSNSAESRRNKRITQWNRVRQRERAGRSRHAVVRSDVVLDEYGNTVHGSAHVPRFAFRIQRGSDFERVRIQLEDASERRSGSIDLRNTIDVHLAQCTRSVSSGRHPTLQLRDGCFVQLERRRSLMARKYTIDYGRSTRASGRRKCARDPNADERPPAEFGRNAVVGRGCSHGSLLRKRKPHPERGHDGCVFRYYYSAQIPGGCNGGQEQRRQGESGRLEQGKPHRQGQRPKLRPWHDIARLDGSRPRRKHGRGRSQSGRKGCTAAGRERAESKEQEEKLGAKTAGGTRATPFRPALQGLDAAVTAASRMPTHERESRSS